MRNRVTGCIRLMCVIVFLLGAFTSPAQEPKASAAEDPQLAAQEKEGCERNLQIIREAIQAYVNDHKDLPNWLSDLVPQYISDVNVLICPVSKRTGQMESGALSDPRLPSSYLFEFCPVPLGPKLAPGDPKATRRDWKRKQMGLVGSVVPIVRCRQHAKVLNLAFDGHIYDSPISWEDLLTNKVDTNSLSPSHLFAAIAGAGAEDTTSKVSCPPRDPATPPNLINLSAYYNAALTESWHGRKQKNDLSSLPTGVQTLAGVEYDIRGIVQLGSKSSSARRFPPRIDGIKINQKCAALHFLHAVGFGTRADDGKETGHYVIHFAANNMQLEIPLVYGREVRNWHSFPGEAASSELTVAWTGTNTSSATMHRSIRLFTTTWTNIAPALEIKSIDFVSAMKEPAPFLIAITADRP